MGESLTRGSFDSVATAGQEARLESKANVNEIEKRRESMRPERAASVSSTATPPVLVTLDTKTVEANNNNNSDSPQSTPVSKVNSCDSTGTARTRMETTDFDAGCSFEDDRPSNTISNNNNHTDPKSPSRTKRPTLAVTLSEQAATFSRDEEDNDESAAAGNVIVRNARRVHRQWVYYTSELRKIMLKGVTALAMTAARHPRYTIVAVVVLSLALVAVGYFTNFELRLDNDKLFTPTNSEYVEYEVFNDEEEYYVGTDLDVIADINGIVTPYMTAQRRMLKPRPYKPVMDRLVTFDIITPEDDDVDIITPEDDEGDDEEERDFAVEVGEKEGAEFNDTKAELVEEEQGFEIFNFTEVAGAEDEEEANNDEPAPYTGRIKRGRLFSFLIHADTENIFTIEGIHKAFDVIDRFRSTPDYKELCTGAINTYTDINGESTCEIRFITRFWNHNRTKFMDEIKTEDDLFSAADAVFYEDEGLVDLTFVLGELREDEYGRPIYGESFYGWFYMKSDYTNFENLLTDHLMGLRNEWNSDSDNMFNLEFAGITAFEREAMTSILGDLPLLPCVFVIMCMFTCLVFFKWDRVKSRSLLGIGAVVTITLSIMSGYGLMFICGVPVTMMTNLLIFVVFGIGLDDTFIITGAYFRTSHKQDPVQRIEQTMEAVGPSIILTTITTTIAFVLGSTSTIRPISWLCMYAFPTVIIDFIYQITFFVALMVLDERRIQENRRDCCVWVTVPKKDESDDERTMTETPTNTPVKESAMMDASLNVNDIATPRRHMNRRGSSRRQHNYVEPLSNHPADRFMRWFAEKLMNPIVKVLVLVVFAAFAGLCVYSTTKMRQAFNFKDLLPKGSYAADYVTAVEHYSDRAMSVSVNFRFVDQADPVIRAAMEQYIDDLLSDVDALNEEPPLCWVREFRLFVSTNETLAELPFYDQLDTALANPGIQSAFGRDFKYREDGTILSSKCTMYVTDLDMESVQAQINFIQQTRAVAAKQPVNKNVKLSCFFVYDLLFHMFAFYEVAANQLAVTTISSVVSVCVVAFVLIPHWSAVPIIFPVISVLFIEMIGVLQMFGYSVNIITYIVLVISIGLLVDFIMHVLLRYYESVHDSREEKVKDALGTMGASILVGGLSTFLGVTPLIFSASEIFSTVCIAFLSMVFLGVSHGLILLPVLLSYFGTEDEVIHQQRPSLRQISHRLSQRIHQSLSDMSPRKSERHIGQSMSDMSWKKSERAVAEV